jgi:hypothetical protein
MSKILIEAIYQTLALEALEDTEALLSSAGMTHILTYGTVVKAISGLREALAEQPEQPQQKPLTDEKIEEIAAITLFPIEFARAIEAAHGIKVDA